MKFRILGIVVLLASAAIVRGEGGWTLTDAALQRRPVDFQSIDDAGVRLAAPGQTLPFDEFVSLERPGTAAAAPAKFTLLLSGGDLLRGEMAAYKDEKIIWKSTVLGEVQVPVRDARAMLGEGAAAGSLDEERSEDRITLTNGDHVSGVVASFDGEKFSIQGTDGAVEVPVAAVSSIYFAAPAQKPQAPGRAFRVRLADGSSFTAASVRTEPGKLELKLAGGQSRTLDLAAVVGIEQLNGPVSWLSAHTPAKTEQTPYFSDRVWPTRFDRNLDDHPIRFGKTTYARGIAVHSRSRLVFNLDGGYRAFRTQYAIDPEHPAEKADVTVRILLDDKVVHEKEHFRAGELAPVVLVDLSGGKALTLEVDYGSGADVQDRLDWIEPALLRKMPPAPPPPPAPAETQPATLPATQPSGPAPDPAAQ